jgi:hypothetical protein
LRVMTTTAGQDGVLTHLLAQISDF